jgi:hypothetical protein
MTYHQYERRITMAVKKGAAVKPTTEVKKDEKAEKVIAAAKEKAVKTAEEKLAAKAKADAEKAEKAEATRIAREAKKAAKEAAKNREPEFVEQLNDKNEIELVDKNKFPYEVVCSVCGSIRYVTKSGLGLVDKCKYHAKTDRRKRRMATVKGKAKMYAAIVQELLAKNLIPDSMKKKYGIK